MMSRRPTCSLNVIRHALLAFQALARRTGDAAALESANNGLNELCRAEAIVAEAAMESKTA